MSIDFFRGARCFQALAMLALTVAAGNVCAQTQTHEHKLANGLRVIVKEDHRAPTVVSMVWYKAGSMDEFNGTTGVAHVLEHMMFKGTKTVPAGEFSKIIAAAGGRDNAFTGKDATGYHQQLRNRNCRSLSGSRPTAWQTWCSRRRSSPRRSRS
jgi:zinc protease